MKTVLENSDELRYRNEDRKSIEKEDGFVNLTKKAFIDSPRPGAILLQLYEAKHRTAVPPIDWVLHSMSVSSVQRSGI